jgi:hypothetical protein
MSAAGGTRAPGKQRITPMVRLAFARDYVIRESEVHRDMCDLHQIAPQVYETEIVGLLIHTNSYLELGQLIQAWRVKAANLPPLVDEAKSLMAAFDHCDLLKVSRHGIMRVLGH